MRWLSPPDKVPEPRARVRYSSPTLTRKPSRSLISRKMRRAISFCLALRMVSRPANHAWAAEMDKAAASVMVRPPSLTARASGLSLWPPQTSQGAVVWNLDNSSRTQALSVSL